MKLLEEELGVQLFERRAAGVLLTPEGREFLRHAKNVLNTVEAARAGMRVYQGIEVGRVSVGVPGSLISLLTVPLVEEVQSQLTGVQLRVVSGLSGHIQRWITEGVLDFGLVYGKTPPVGLDVESLLVEELFVATLDGSALMPALTPTGELPLQRLAGLPLVLPGREHGLRATVEEAANRTGVSLWVRTELDAPEQLKEMARRPGVYTILSLAAIRNDSENLPLFTARIIEPSIERTVSLAHATGRPLSRAARRVDQILREIIRREISKDTLTYSPPRLPADEAA
jgi:LysR family nitrogen assimilation transcriptional regulator